MRVFGNAGHSGMRKTTLLVRLVAGLTARGLGVSLIEHSHKGIEIDRPGKGSCRLREAGCSELLLPGNDRCALRHRLRGADEPPLDGLLSRLQRCDLVLVEGFKGGDAPKPEVWRAEVGRPTPSPDRPGTVAVASDTAGPASAAMRLDLPDVAAIADFVLSNAAPMDTMRSSGGVSGPRGARPANAAIENSAVAVLARRLERP